MRHRSTIIDPRVPGGRYLVDGGGDEGVEIIMVITEQAFMQQVIDLARWYKWRVAHFRPAMTKQGRWVTAVQADGIGFPDLVMCRSTRLIFAELKSEKGKVTKEQTDWFFALTLVRFVEVHIWRPRDIDEIDDTLK